VTAFLRDRRVLLGLAFLSVLHLATIPSRPEPRLADVKISGIDGASWRY
jgi:hypothetical protein